MTDETRSGGGQVTDWTTHTDPTGAFSVDAPADWQTEVAVVRHGVAANQVVRSRDPDTGTLLFSGDPQMPMFTLPGTLSFGAPGQVVAPYMPAEMFIRQWAQQSYGGITGFRSTEPQPVPDFHEITVRNTKAIPVRVLACTTARIDIWFDPDGAPRRGLLLCATTGVEGLWLAYTHGVVTPAPDVEPYLPALLRLVGSMRTTSAESERQRAERARMDAQHAANMAAQEAFSANMTATHQQNMAHIQSSGAAHQARMQTMQAGFDAQNRAWADRQAASDQQHQAFMGQFQPAVTDSRPADVGHRAFIDAVRSEETVRDAEGVHHKVEAGAETYYYNRHHDTWIGVPTHKSLSDLGLDPTQWEEGRPG